VLQTEKPEAALDRWTIAFVNAKTLDECDRIAAEANSHVSGEELVALKQMYKDARTRIKAGG
jgi:hypothetical protein